MSPFSVPNLFVCTFLLLDIALVFVPRFVLSDVRWYPRALFLKKHPELEQAKAMHGIGSFLLGAVSAVAMAMVMQNQGDAGTFIVFVAFAILASVNCLRGVIELYSSMSVKIGLRESFLKRRRQRPAIRFVVFRGPWNRATLFDTEYKFAVRSKYVRKIAIFRLVVGLGGFVLFLGMLSVSGVII